MPTLYRTGSGFASPLGISGIHPVGYNDGMTTGKRIAEARTAAKLTQSELARRMGVKPQMVNQWESGKKGLSGRNLAKLAQALNANLAYLLYGKRDLREHVENDILTDHTPRGVRVPLVSIEDVVLRAPISVDTPKVIANLPCSSKALAFKLPDDSNAPHYPLGTIWVIDPDEKPRPGDMVVATFGSTNPEPVCGVYSVAATPAGRCVLVTPINTTWPAARSDLDKVDVVGVMTESIHGRRR